MNVCELFNSNSATHNECMWIIFSNSATHNECMWII